MIHEADRAGGSACSSAMTNEADSPGRGFFKRLRAKLTRARVADHRHQGTPAGRKIDAEILDDLETRLISADVGVEAAARILGDLRKRVARKELDDVDALLRRFTRHVGHLEARRAARSTSMATSGPM